MITKTFTHIPRVGKGFEEKLRMLGVSSWQDFLEKKESLSIPEQKKENIFSYLKKSFEAINKEEYEFFKTLPRNQHWRLYDFLKKRTCFLDIETTGLCKHYNDITLIGMHSEEGTKIFMKGKNLEEFKQELKKYSMIVTFNGCCFDIPFIKNKYPEIEISSYHVDLRFLTKKLGLSGGLKVIEQEMNIIRDKELLEVDGFEAVRLWKKYEKGNKSALSKLKKYLTADVENLKILLEKTIEELKKENNIN